MQAASSPFVWREAARSTRESGFMTCSVRGSGDYFMVFIAEMRFVFPFFSEVVFISHIMTQLCWFLFFFTS